MLYASSKDRFKRELDGIQVELQATDPSEMSLDIIKGRVNLSFFFPFRYAIIIPIDNYFASLTSNLSENPRNSRVFLANC